MEREQVEQLMDQRVRLASAEAVVLRLVRRRRAFMAVVGLAIIAGAVAFLAAVDTRETAHYVLAGFGALYGLYYLVRGGRPKVRNGRPAFLFDREGMVSLLPPRVAGWEEVRGIEIDPEDPADFTVYMQKELDELDCNLFELGVEPDELRDALARLRELHGLQFKLELGELDYQELYPEDQDEPARP